LYSMAGDSPVALCRPLPYDRRAAPSKDGGGALEWKTDDYSTPTQDYAVTSCQRDWSPPSLSVLCGHLRRPTPSQALHHHLLHCGGTGRLDAATPAAVRPAASRQPHPRANVRTTTKRATPAPPPSKPLLDGYRVRHDAPPNARFARTAVYSVALYAMPPYVDKIVRHDVSCLLLGL
jgi:glyoxylase-like metal-dependent hydrolase (beta-lactamase superfamily II)